MKFNATIPLVILSLMSFNATAFGPKGHRVVGHICQDNLSPKALTAIKAILGKEKLSFAAAWPDEMRNSTSDTEFWSMASNWHFVNIPAGKTYVTSMPSDQGDSIVAIKAFSNVLKGIALEDGPIKSSLQTYFGDIDAPENQLPLKQFAVRFIVHIVGDLHQPLHSGYKSDRGGNSIKVKWFGQPANLHEVWDEFLIDEQQLSFTELVSKLDVLSDREENLIQSSELMDWLQESVVLRKVAYDVDKYNSRFGDSYVFEQTPVVNARLQQAGLRAAKFFNDIFE